MHVANEALFIFFQDLCVVLDGKGNVLNRSIDGQIVMRSFLSGCPNLTMQLNDDLVVGPSGPPPSPQLVFHLSEGAPAHPHPASLQLRTLPTPIPSTCLSPQ